MGTCFCKSMSNGYSILTWNTLCTEISIKENFPKTEEKFLNWEYRKNLIKDILITEKPDIITLQEIDNYEEFKKDILEKLKIKYKGNFYIKPDGKMGIFLGVNPEKFMILNIYKEILPGGDDEENKFSNQIFIVSEIKDLKTEQIFFLISTHLKSKIHNENIRLIQTQGIISYINEKGLFKKNIIVTGDFNVEPNYQSIVNFQKYGMKSAFQFNTGDYTMFMFRDNIKKRYIDYIFYKGNLVFGDQQKAIVDIDEKCGLPNYEFPSDHLFLKAKFKFI